MFCSVSVLQTEEYQKSRHSESPTPGFITPSVPFAERRIIDMKITGSRNYIKFDFENGYVAKAEGGTELKEKIY